jgi:hypothetical protein
MLSTLVADLTFALRQLRRNPGFAVSAIITLAFGIGATTAIFSLVDGILLRPLPFTRVDRLLAIETLEIPAGVAPSNVAAANYVSTSYPDFFDWQRENHTFESLASYDVHFRPSKFPRLAKAARRGAPLSMIPEV